MPRSRRSPLRFDTAAALALCAALAHCIPAWRRRRGVHPLGEPLWYQRAAAHGAH